MKLNESCTQPSQATPTFSRRPRRSASPRSSRRSPAKADSLTSDLRPPTSSPYSIRKHISFWSLTFNGQEACFDHEQGAYYVAYLLLNPPDEPIHGMALEFKARAYFDEWPIEPCETVITDPETGQTITLGFDAEIMERHLSVDEGDGLPYVRRKQHELEAIIADEAASEPVKAEVQRELEEMYFYQKRNAERIRDTAQKAVRAVREAIHHFHQSLTNSVNAKGNPHPVLRPFASHIESYLIIPSARFSKQGRARSKANGAGCQFISEPNGWPRFAVSSMSTVNHQSNSNANL